MRWILPSATSRRMAANGRSSRRSTSAGCPLSSLFSIPNAARRAVAATKAAIRARALQGSLEAAVGPQGASLRPAVGDKDGVRGEQLRKAGDVAGGGRAQEGVQQPLVLLAGGGDQPPARRHLLACALQQLAAGGRAACDETRDLHVRKIEHIVQEQGGALGGREPLQDHEDGHGELLDGFQARHSRFRERDRLGQAVAAALFAPRPRRVELVQAEPRHHRHQERPRRVDLDLASVPAQPGLLHHVLGTPHVSQHAIREREHRGPVELEDGEVFRGRHGTARSSLSSPGRRSRARGSPAPPHPA